MIYLDNAATTFPKPERVYAAHDKAFRECAGNHGRGSHALAAAASRCIEETRFLLAKLINAPCPAAVSFTYNATGALNLALKGALKSGDHVVTCSFEHNAVARPLEALKGRGVSVTKVAPRLDGEGVHIDDVTSAFRQNTKLAVFTHISNVTGAENPVAEIGLLCRERGALFLVDAAQSAGCRAVDVHAMNIDLLAFPGHKGLFGPQGTGALYARRGIVLDTLIEGGTGIFSENLEMPRQTPARYESGTQNAPGIAALGEGLKFIFETGIDVIAAHEAALASRLIEGVLRVKGARVFGPPAGGARSSVVSFTLDGASPQHIDAVLSSVFGIAVRSGLHCAPDAHRSIGTLQSGGTVRASCGFFNTRNDVDALIEAVRDIVKN
jgi:cysteine desulfurase family protein